MTADPRLSVLHLSDSVTLGGVPRMIEALMAGLCDVARHVHATGQNGILANPSLKNIDLVIVHAAATWSTLPALLALRLRLATRPLVLIEHSYTEALERELVEARPRFRRLLRMAYGLSDCVVSVSEGQTRWMVEAALVSQSKLVTIPPISPCVHLASLALPQSRAISPAQPFRFGAAGRMSDAKGFDYLLDAMAMLQKAPVHLALAGAGPLEGALRAKAESLPNVSMVPAYSDAASFFQGVDAVVIPSVWEAYGLVAMEARLAGRPIIASHVDGLAEQINATFGRLVPSKSSAALAQAMTELMACDVHAMGQNARLSAIGHAAAALQAWSKLLSDLAPRMRSVSTQTEQHQVVI
jgi:glycosyltransferase involved in cell wall biosynthesis